MGTQTVDKTKPGLLNSSPYLAGAAGGFVGSIFFGLIMQFVIAAPLLEVIIPAMYGIEGPALMMGWAIHQFHGVVLGIAYVAAVESGPLAESARRLGSSVALGVGYGILTTILLAVLVMPLWLSAVGFADGPPFPNVAFPGTIVVLIGHIVYAIPVAVGYALAVQE